MTIDELLNTSSLMPLPLRAWLSLGEEGSGGRGWTLHDRWMGVGEQPILCGTKLRLLDLGDSLHCVALVAHAVVPGHGLEIRDTDERAVIYLLNPADPVVRKAVECWLRRKAIRVVSGGGVLTSSTLNKEATVLEECQRNEGDEIICDFVTGALIELWRDGRLEGTLKSGLGINRPLLCAIVETPMLCASLQPPLTREEVEAYEAHQANKFLLEGIAS